MKQNLCDHHRLTAFLNDDLSDLEIKHLTLHLDACSDCSQRLEQLAAPAGRWNDVKINLSNGYRQRQPSEIKPWASNTPTSTVPFTVQQIGRMLNPTDNPNSLGRLGSYEVIGVVGSGAMGTVLKAVDPTLDRVVALKVMNPTLAGCGTARNRFAREAKAAAGVLHPNIIAIHGVDSDRELPFLVMPYVAGESLQQRLDREGPLGLVEILRIGSQLAAGLAAAHQKGLIHRDIKPSNVMLDKGVETAVITDFGLARTIDDATMTRSGAIAGTPEYMSPEQARGEPFDCSSDVFSLGSLLYALCVGNRPFRARTTFGVLRKITDEEPTPIRQLTPEIPTWLCTLIKRMHSKSPQQRPTSNEVHDFLVACLAHVYQPDRMPVPAALADTTSTTPFPLISRTYFRGAIAMMTLICFVTLLYATQFNSPTSQTPTQVSSDQPVFKTHRLTFPNQNQTGRLVVDINRGFIEVEGYDGDEVLIELLTPEQFASASDEESGFQTLFTPKYDLDVQTKGNSIKFDAYNQDYCLDLRIKVPFRTDLSLDTYTDGHIVAKGIAGTIKAESQHNDIALLGIRGSATAYSRNGNLQVTFHEVAADATLDFESYNGSIDISLPESIKTSTAIASGISSCKTAFKIEPAVGSDRPDSLVTKVNSNIEEYQFGKINGGGIPMRIESEKGKITIRKTNLQTR